MTDNQNSENPKRVKTHPKNQGRKTPSRGGGRRGGGRSYGTFIGGAAGGGAGGGGRSAGVSLIDYLDKSYEPPYDGVIESAINDLEYIYALVFNWLGIKEGDVVFNQDADGFGFLGQTDSYDFKTEFTAHIRVSENELIKANYPVLDRDQENYRLAKLNEKYKWIVSFISENGQKLIKQIQHYIDEMLFFLDTRGKGVLILPSAFLYETSEIEKYRIKLLNENIIEKVIELPAIEFKKVDYCCVFFSKGKKDKSIFLSDASHSEWDDFLTVDFDNETSKIRNGYNSAHGRLVNNQEIVEANYRLLPRWYLGKLIITDEENPTPLRDLVNVIHSPLVLKGKNPKNVIKENAEFPILAIKQLKAVNNGSFSRKTHPKNFAIDFDKIPRTQIQDISLLPGDIIIRIHGPSYEVGMLEKEIEAFILPTLLALRIKPNIKGKEVNRQYLFNWLKSENFRKEYYRRSDGKKIVEISENELLSIFIPLPDPIKQELDLIRLHEAELLDNEEEFKSKLVSVKEQFYGSFMHEINNALSPLFLNLDSLNAIMGKLGVLNKPFGQAQTIGGFLENEVPKYQSEIIEMEKNIKGLLDLDKDYKKIAKRADYFRTLFEKNVKDQEYGLAITTNGFNSTLKNVMVELYPRLMELFVSNWVRNFHKHATKTDSKHHLELNAYCFNLSDFDLETDMLGLTTSYLILDLIDFGNGFAKGFDFLDFIKYGERSSNKSGSGIGGFIMHEVMKRHGFVWFESSLVGSNREVEYYNSLDTSGKKLFNILKSLSQKELLLENTNFGLSQDEENREFGVYYRIIIPINEI